MSDTNKTKHSRGWIAWLIPLLLAYFALLIKHLIYDKNIALFDSKGLVAHEQRSLIILTGVLLLSVALPTIVLLYFTAWKYRESNTKAVHNPDAGRSKLTVWSMWLIPTTVAVVMTAIMWPATHRLVPQKLISSDAKPLTIQVISMRWKWLFLYPEQHIASVNFVQLPANTPVTFELTADDMPMSSFWIPNLGGQLYSMTGHVNNLNLMAETPGEYPGSSAELNGAGFTGMKFTASVGSTEEFAGWVDAIKQNSRMLDATAYNTLVKPSENNPATFYSAYDSSLYDKVVMKYMGAGGGHMEHM